MMTPLQAAVFRRDPVTVQNMDAAAHIDAKGYGDTPFQMAAALLRRYGADVNAPAADDAISALQAAAKAGNCELVQEMLVSGSEINAATNPHGGHAALQVAAESVIVESAKTLIGSAWSQGEC